MEAHGGLDNAPVGLFDLLGASFLPVFSFRHFIEHSRLLLLDKGQARGYSSFRYTVSFIHCCSNIGDSPDTV